jgi:hypothetical protein
MLRGASAAADFLLAMNDYPSRRTPASIATIKNWREASELELLSVFENIDEQAAPAWAAVRVRFIGHRRRFARDG